MKCIAKLINFINQWHLFWTTILRVLFQNVYAFFFLCYIIDIKKREIVWWPNQEHPPQTLFEVEEWFTRPLSWNRLLRILFESSSFPFRELCFMPTQYSLPITNALESSGSCVFRLVLLLFSCLTSFHSWVHLRLIIFEFMLLASNLFLCTCIKISLLFPSFSENYTKSTISFKAFNFFSSLFLYFFLMISLFSALQKSMLPRLQFSSWVHRSSSCLAMHWNSHGQSQTGLCSGLPPIKLSSLHNVWHNLRHKHNSNSIYTI